MRFLSFALVLHCLACSIAGRENPPVAVQGLLDLRSEDLSRPIELNGQWEFFWEEIKIPDPEEPAHSGIKSTSSFAMVPGSWKKHNISDSSSSTGFATYRLRILLPEPGRPLALRIPVQGSAILAYWNLAEIGRAGTVASDPAREDVMYLPLYSEIPAGAEGILSIVLSNHFNPRAGLRVPLTLGDADIVLERRSQARLLEAFLAGALLILGIYHMGLFSFRMEDLTPLWFALMCTSIALRSLLTGEHLLLELIALDDRFVLQAKILTFYTAVVWVSLFFQSFFPAEFQRPVTLATIATTLVGSAMVLFLPTSVYQHTILPIQLLAMAYVAYALVRVWVAMIHRRTGAQLILWGGAILFVTVANDIFFTWFWRGRAHLAPYGLLFLAVTLALALSRRIADAFEKSERLTRDLKQAYTEAIGLKDRLRQSEKLATIGDMAAGIVHDLKNPVAVIKGFKEMADQDDLGREKRRHFLDTIDKEADRMLALVQDLLDFSRGSAAVAREWIDPRDFVERIKTVLDPLFRSRSIEYSLKLEVVQNLYLDPERLLRALTNIAGNAADALDGQDEARFCLRILQKGDQNLFEMVDNGPGIPPEIRETLFEPFATYGKEHGTGLGMAIARSIVQAHGGSIHFQTSEKGTVFTIALPSGNPSAGVLN